MKKPTPSNLENVTAERIVVGKVLQSESTYWQLADLLQPMHFSRPIHQKIYGAVKDIITEGKKLSLTLIQSRIGEDYEDESGESKSTMTLMTALMRDSDQVEGLDEVELIIDLWKRRKYLDELKRSQKKAEDPEAYIADLITEHEIRVQDIGQNSQTEPLMSIGQIAKTAMEKSTKTRDSGITPGYDTGLPSLDEILGRIHPGDLGIIGADPGIGKTILAQQIGWHVAKNLGKPVIFFQLEMHREDMGRRYLAGQSQMSTAQVEEGAYDFDQYENLKLAVDRAEGVPLYIDDRQELTVQQIGDRCLSIKRGKGLAIAIVDHLLKIEANGNFKDYFAKTKYITGKLKNIAKQLEIGIICLAHRTLTAQRASYIPRIGDLDGGSSIQRDADWVIAMVREEVWLDSNRPHADQASGEYREWIEKLAKCRGTAEIYNLKGRRTPRGTKRDFRFDGKGSRISEIEK